jgi:sn-glycerol 3-phosphate transport system substrate-binding protein
MQHQVGQASLLDHRLGGFVEIRNIIQEELEKALQGQQTGAQALENANRRGNVVLRNFERANKG